MCLIAFAINASERWPLVIASNRDEFLNRPTLPLARWQTPSGHQIVSGRDLRAGGTWLGMTPTGRVAFLTNVREAGALAAPLSRGELVTRWLEADCDAAAFVAALQTSEGKPGGYGGFNLVLGDFHRNAWTWVTNRPAPGNKPASGAANWQLQTLAPGIYGLSNAALDTPWPKITQVKAALTDTLNLNPDAKDPQALRTPLWAALADRKRASRESLPATGVPLALEEALSSAFVYFPENAYGTRSSTVLLAGAHETFDGRRCWEVQVQEREHLYAEADASISSSARRWRNHCETMRWL